MPPPPPLPDSGIALPAPAVTRAGRMQQIRYHQYRPNRVSPPAPATPKVLEKPSSIAKQSKPKSRDLLAGATWGKDPPPPGSAPTKSNLKQSSISTSVSVSTPPRKKVAFTSDVLPGSPGSPITDPFANTRKIPKSHRQPQAPMVQTELEVNTYWNSLSLGEEHADRYASIVAAAREAERQLTPYQTGLPYMEEDLARYWNGEEAVPVVKERGRMERVVLRPSGGDLEDMWLGDDDLY